MPVHKHLVPVEATQAENFIYALMKARLAASAKGVAYYVYPNTEATGEFVCSTSHANLFTGLIYTCVTPDGCIKQRKKAAAVGSEDERPWR